MHPDGFITLHRKIVESWLWQLSPSDFKIALTCAFMANWADGKWFDGQEMIFIPRGTFVSSTAKIANKAGKGITDKMVRGCLRRLVAAEFLELVTQRGKRYSTVTIVNYNRYQDVQSKEGKPAGELRANSGQSEGELRATIEQEQPGNKETKEQKNSLSEVSPSDAGSKKKKSSPPVPEVALRCANYLRDRIVQKDPGHKLSHTFTDSQRENWGRRIDLLNRKDSRSWKEIAVVIDWLHDTENKFVVFSASALRDKFDHIRRSIKAAKGPEYLNGQRKLPPPQEQPAQPERPEGETREEWEARKEKERADRH